MTRFFALCASAAVLLSCGSPGAAKEPPPKPPAAGVMLLSLSSGALVRQRAVGEDPLAVTLAPDGGIAYVVDNELGDVFALRLPALTQAWRTHVGGAPGPALVAGGTLYVSEYDTGLAAALDRRTGRPLGTLAVGPHPGELVLHDGAVTAAGGAGFGLADVAGSLWTWGRLATLPGLHPFWLQAGRPGELLATEEGTPEDTAAGAVLAIDTANGDVSTIATPRDPDEVVRAGADVFIAAHGDRDVLVLRSGEPVRWAQGAEAVAVAPDTRLGLLVVVTDADE